MKNVAMRLENEVFGATYDAKSIQNLIDSGVAEAGEQFAPAQNAYQMLIDVLQSGIDNLKFLRDHKHDYVSTDDKGGIVCCVCGLDGNA